jgi:hypothetical protein
MANSLTVNPTGTISAGTATISGTETAADGAFANVIVRLTQGNVAGSAQKAVPDDGAEHAWSVDVPPGVTGQQFQPGSASYSVVLNAASGQVTKSGTVTLA